MISYPIGDAWHVLYVAPGADRIVRNKFGEWVSPLAQEVAILGFDVYQPRDRSMKTRRRQRVEVVEPLFSRYLFVAFDPVRSDRWMDLLQIDGVEDVLGSQNQFPSRIPTAWVDALRRAELAGAFDRTPNASPFKVGDAVRIAEGPFAGLTAHVQQLIAKLKSATASKRVKVLMQFLGSATVIDLPVASVEKV